MIAMLVGWLLHRANAAPPRIGREAFYAMKDRLVARYGYLIGTDYQHILKPCWDGPCERCGGTGVWTEFYVELDRWQIARWIFHRPMRRLIRICGGPKAVTIEGYIHHAGYGALSVVCALLLAILFDRPLFWTLLRSPSTVEWPGWPLHTLQQLLRSVRQAWNTYGPAECWKCGTTFIRFWAISPSSCICGHCHFVRSFLASIRPEVDDIPF
jgi:hypothetical protein